MLKKQDEELVAMKGSLEAAKKDQRTAYQKALSAKGAVDDRLTRVESLTKEREFIADQLKARERDIFFHQELVRYHMRENVELKLTIEARKKEVDDLRRSLRETEGKLENAREVVEWFTASSLPFPLTWATVTIVGDNIYLVGEFDENVTMTRSVLTCSLTALSSPANHTHHNHKHHLCGTESLTLQYTSPPVSHYMGN